MAVHLQSASAAECPLVTKTTRCLNEQVRRKRPYIQLSWCSDVIAGPCAAACNRPAPGTLPGHDPAPWRSGAAHPPGRDAGQRRNRSRRILRSGPREEPGLKLHHCPDTDSLYAEFRAAPRVKTHGVADGLNVDLDADGDVVRFDIDHASRRLDLSPLETTSSPLQSTRIG